MVGEFLNQILGQERNSKGEEEEKGETEEVKRLVSEGANSGEALYYASHLGIIAAVKTILKTRPDINVRWGRERKTPMIISVEKDHLDIFGCLTEAGAMGNVKDNGGKTAYDHAKTDEKRKTLEKTVLCHASRNNYAH